MNLITTKKNPQIVNNSILSVSNTIQLENKMAKGLFNHFINDCCGACLPPIYERSDACPLVTIADIPKMGLLFLTNENNP